MTKRNVEIVECVCPCCGREHLGRNCRKDSLCRNCKVLAANDYSDGFGLPPRVNLVIRKRKPRGNYKKKVDFVETENKIKV